MKLLSKSQSIVMSILVLGLCSAQVENGKGFKIEVSEDEKKTTLVCQHGCAWRELSFTKPSKNDVIVVDQFGMITNNTRDILTTDASLADFKFSIFKDGDKYVLESLGGTAWKDLSFNVKPYVAPQILDASGVAVPN